MLTTTADVRSVLQKLLRRKNKLLESQGHANCLFVHLHFLCMDDHRKIYVHCACLIFPRSRPNPCLFSLLHRIGVGLSVLSYDDIR